MQFICAESKAPAAPFCFMLLVEHIWDRCNHATWGLMKDSRNVNMLNYSHMQIGCALNAIVPAWNTQVLLKERTSCFTYALAYVPYVVCIWTGNGELCCTGNPTFLPLRVTDLTRGFSSLQLFFFTYCLIQRIQKSAHLIRYIIKFSCSSRNSFTFASSRHSLQRAYQVSKGCLCWKVSDKGEVQRKKKRIKYTMECSEGTQQ